MTDTLKPVQTVETDMGNLSWVVWGLNVESLTYADARLAVLSILDGGCQADMVSFRDGRRFRVAPAATE